MIGAPGERSENLEDDGDAVAGPLVVVHEGVAGVRILFDVVRDTRGGEHVLEPRRVAAIPPILGAVARDDWTRAGKVALGIDFFRRGPIVHAGRSVAMPRREQQREPAAMQKPMTPTLPVQLG